MGFSISGSFAILVVATIIAVGTFATAASNGLEDVTDARQAVAENRLDRANTDINITNASYDADTDTLSVSVDNTGSTGLSVNGTDVIVDNAHQSSFTVRTVDGNATTDLWLPGETLHVEVSTATSPTRVKVVTETGVADTEGV